MLSPKTQLNLKNAKHYFREHLSVGEYYADGQKVAGHWFGAGAEKLGLAGVVTEKEFLRLCEGLHPQTGERLTLRRNSSRRESGQVVANRRVFYDFTISPPKSVSVLGLLQDDRIIAEHDRAVQVAILELEKLAETRVRKGGASGSRLTGNVVGTTFRHDTSRELDPHLHTHCILLNATFDPVEGCWKALEAGLLHRAQKLVENAYYHELCRGLQRLGYEVASNRRGFEIKGVPQSVIECFSKRRQQIDEETRRRIAKGELRGNEKAFREQISREIRKRKTHATSGDRLLSDWQRQISREDRAALRACHGTRRGPAPDAADVEKLISWADEHLFERHAVVEDFDVLSACLARGRGQNFDLRELRETLDWRDYVRDAGSTKLTSREVLRRELALVFAARDGRGRHSELAPEFSPSPKLSDEQEKAVRHILGSRDFITLFRGGAGTGKSFALQEVYRGITGSGQSVVTLAPQRQQVTDLTRDGLPARTVAEVLASRSVPAGAVVIVDEAGQIGGRQFLDLVELTKSRGGRLVLSGDTRQHGAVAASDALRAIEAYGWITPAEIETIRRQSPELGRTPTERSRIAQYRTAVKAAAAGDIVGSFERLNRLGCIRESDENSRRGELAHEFLAALKRNESALVVGQTWAEVRGVNEAIRERLIAEGRLPTGGAVSTFQAVDSTVAERRDPSFFRAGQHVFFVQRYGRFAKGEICEVCGASERGISILKDGRRSTLSFRYAERVIVANQVPLEIAQGDRVQLKFNGRSVEGRALNNGELVTVCALRADGRIVVEDSGGARKTLAPGQRLFNRGYAVTSYASQGKTVDTVLIADASNRAATTSNQWYVSISRGRKRVVVFTSDKAALRSHIQRAGGRELALELKPAEAGEGQITKVRLRPAWVRRAWAAIRTIQKINFIKTRRPEVRRMNNTIKL